MATLLSTVNSEAQTAAYLRTLPAIRERCARVHALAQEGKLQYFDYHPEKEADVAVFCEELMKRDFGTDFAKIPTHGRWRHIDAGRERVKPLIDGWAASSNPPDKTEVARRLLDLFLVSVLLDAGAGADWSYTEATDSGSGTYTRSEGLAVASVKMFEDGLFSGVADQPHRVDAKGLSVITTEKVASAMQVSAKNPMVGLEGRAGLLQNLANALTENPQFFGPEARPGGIVDYLASQLKPGAPTPTVHVSALWTALIDGLAAIWPKPGPDSGRTSFGGVPLGDVWPCPALRASLGENPPPGADLVPFHKLTGWTAYSLIEPLQTILGWTVEGTEDMTGLPEYRNGGLLVDFGVLTLRADVLPAEFWPSGPSGLPKLPPSHPAIVEWRAMTIVELDRVAEQVRQRLGTAGKGLALAQIIEAATWKGGREIAKKKRPQTGGPPIDIISDGTVF